MFDQKSIILNCSETKKESIIRFLAQKAHEAGYVSDVETYVHAVLEREKEFSTGVGFNIGIPHGKAESVKEAFVMFTRVNNVDWQSLDGEPVDMVFQIGVPASDAGDQHLRILAQLSRKLMNDDFRAALRSAKDAQEVIGIYKEYGLVD